MLDIFKYSFSDGEEIVYAIERPANACNSFFRRGCSTYSSCSTVFFVMANGINQQGVNEEEPEDCGYEVRRILIDNCFANLLNCLFFLIKTFISSSEKVGF